MIIQGIYLKTGLYPRGLADRFRYKIPFWRDFITASGGVLGTPEMCRSLMQSKESIIVFPGGRHEVMKSRTDNNKLIWKERTGFARMAIENGYSITPFASIGPDEALDPIIDFEDIRKSWINKILPKSKHIKNIPSSYMLPIARGIGLTMIPRPEKFYFSFGPQIETTKYTNSSNIDSSINEVRDLTARCINSMIKECLLIKSQNKAHQSYLRRLMQGL